MVASRFLVVQERLLFWVPAEFAAQAKSDDAKVTDRDGTMADLRVTDRRFPRPNAIKEVFHVIVAHVQLHLFRGERQGQQFRAAGFDLAASDVNPAFAARGDGLKSVPQGDAG